MPTGDSRNPSDRNSKPGDTGADASIPSSSKGAPDSGASQPVQPDDAVDFGSYVSSTVRSSAELFGTPARSASARSRSTRRRSPFSTKSTSGDDEPPSGEISEVDAGAGLLPSRERPSRYWRDSLRSATSRGLGDPDEGDSAGGGRDGTTRRLVFMGFPNRDRSGMAIIGGIALAILASIALIWFLTRGDDGGVTSDPTPTQESVIDSVPSPADDDTDGSTPGGIPPFVPNGTPAPESTEEIRRGGDNQLDQNDDESTPGASTSDDPHAISRAAQAPGTAMNIVLSGSSPTTTLSS